MDNQEQLANILEFIKKEEEEEISEAMRLAVKERYDSTINYLLGAKNELKIIKAHINNLKGE